MCSGITHGRVLSGELYAQTFQKLTNLDLFTDLSYQFAIKDLHDRSLLQMKGVVWGSPMGITIIPCCVAPPCCAEVV